MFKQYTFLYLLSISILLESCNTYKTRDDATENYINNKEKFDDLINLIQKIEPNLSKPPNNKFTFQNKQFSFIFSYEESKDTYDIAFIYEDGSVSATDPKIGGRNIRLDSKKMKDILSNFRLDQTLIDSLAKKLPRTNCNSIISGDPIRMNFGEGKYGIFSYMIFNTPLPDSTIKMYTEKYGDNVIDKKAVIIYTTF